MGGWMGGELGAMGEKGEEIKMHKLPVIKKQGM